MDGSVLAATLLIAAAVLGRIRFVPESERYVVSVDGNFERFSGPGFVLKTLFAGDWTHVCIGDIGEVAMGYVRIRKARIPCVASVELRSGRRVRITAFLKDRVRVEPFA